MQTFQAPMWLTTSGNRPMHIEPGSRTAAASADGNDVGLKVRQVMSWRWGISRDFFKMKGTIYRNIAWYVITYIFLNFKPYDYTS